MSPAQFAALYFETPVPLMRKLEGTAYLGVPSRPQFGYVGYIAFECDQEPVLRDAQQFKSGGHIIGLTDSFVTRFDAFAYSLLHARDTTCLRYIEPGNESSIRWFMHNKKTNKYFFRRGSNDMFPG